MEIYEFLHLKAEGKTNQQIADLKGISLSTLKRFISKNNLKQERKQIIYEEFLDLYNQNKQDDEIASILKVATKSVTNFRKQHKLLSIRDKIRKEKNEEFIKLYKSGLNDSEISRILKVNHVTIHNWRKKIKEVSNFKYKRKFDTDKFLELYYQGYYDYEIAEILGVGHSTINSYRASLQLSPNTYNKDIPTEEQEQIIIGSLLGDMGLKLPKNHKHAVGDFAHSLKQENYCKFKEEKLRNFCSKGFYKTQHDKRTNKDYKCYYVYMKASSYLTYLYEQFYPNKKKIVPKDLLYKLTGLGIAIWFMDDGYKYGNSFGIATNCFSEKDLYIIQEFFKVKYDINISIHSDHTIYILSNSKDKFVHLIEPYIHQDCLYKIYDDHKTPLNGETPAKDNPVLNSQETMNNADRLEVMPNE